MKAAASELAFSPIYRRNFRVLHLLVRGALRALAPRLRVTGRRHIPAKGAVIFAPNHISDVDPPLVGGTVRRPLWYMAKRELWEVEWLGPVMEFFAAFPVDPESPDRAALKIAGGLLARGEGLVLFPEGKISESGEPGVMLPGAVLLALRAQVPVVPVGLWGAQHLMPYGTTSLRFTLQPLRVHYGPPLRFDDLANLAPRDARLIASQRLEAAITAARAVARGTDT